MDDRFRNDYIKWKVGVASIKDKTVKITFRLFEHVKNI